MKRKPREQRVTGASASQCAPATQPFAASAPHAASERRAIGFQFIFEVFRVSFHIRHHPEVGELKPRGDGAFDERELAQWAGGLPVAGVCQPRRVNPAEDEWDQGINCIERASK